MRFLSLFCASLLVTQKGLTLASSLQGVTKGLVAEKVLSSMISNKKPLDFVMCIGDDRSDEDMFESISTTAYSSCLLCMHRWPKTKQS